MKRKPTDKQRKAHSVGIKAQEVAARWLKKHGFNDVKKNPKPTGCWDIKARKGKHKWIIEVKGGENPRIDMANFEKMTRMRGFTKMGLALVTKNYVHLFEYPKMRFAAFRAWDSMRKTSKTSESSKNVTNVENL